MTVRMHASGMSLCMGMLCSVLLLAVHDEERQTMEHDHRLGRYTSTICVLAAGGWWY